MRNIVAPPGPISYGALLEGPERARARDVQKESPLDLLESAGNVSVTPVGLFENTSPARL